MIFVIINIVENRNMYQYCDDRHCYYQGCDYQQCYYQLCDYRHWLFVINCMISGTLKSLFEVYRYINRKFMSHQ